MELHVGLIGLGNRGYWLLRDVLVPMSDVRVTAVCDVYPDRCEKAAESVKEMGGYVPAIETDYKALIGRADVDIVIVASAWENHVEAAICAMKAGKAVAVEVGGAYTVKQCWELVETYETTQTPFMFLENCCYGRREMMVLNMAEQGLLGEIVHCKGGYLHDLRDEISTGGECRHYRLRNYLHRNAENYPTHELGPIAKILNINRGNRMLTLSSTASRAAGLSEYIKTHRETDDPLQTARFAQGDVVNTVIKCAGGETILLTLNTTLPRYYSRDFTVCGTKGMYEEATDSIFFDGEESPGEEFRWQTHWGNAREYEEAYDHPIWKKFMAEGMRGGHDGMDWLVFESFFDSVKHEIPCPIDVYDAASWMCISALSEESIAMGGHPVAIPDFTNGKWQFL